MLIYLDVTFSSSSHNQEMFDLSLPSNITKMF